MFGKARQFAPFRGYRIVCPCRLADTSRPEDGSGGRGQTKGQTIGLTLGLTRVLEPQAEGHAEGAAAVLAEERLRILVVCGHLPESGPLYIGDRDTVGVDAARRIHRDRAIPGNLLLVVEGVID